MSDFIPNFANLDDMPSTTSNKSSNARCFPCVKGIVRISFTDGDRKYEDSFPALPGVFVHDAYRGKTGKLAHLIKGIGFEVMVKNVFKDVFTEEAANNRLITFCYLRQLKKAIENNETYVETCMGLKFIDYGKKRNVSSSLDIDL